MKIVKGYNLMDKKKKQNKKSNNNLEVWTEEEYEKYLADLYGFDFIAGFTDNGVPYGTLKNEIDIEEDDSFF